MIKTNKKNGIVFLVIVSLMLTSCGPTPPKELQQKAEQGDRYAEYLMGKFYEDIKKDTLEAFEWYIKSAQQGFDSAQYQIACLYNSGTSDIVQKNYEAINYFMKAAKQGHVIAQCHLGIYYRDDLGNEIGYEKAASWFRQSAAQNNPDAQNIYACLLEEGLGVKQNLDSAIYYYRLAANNIQAGTYNVGAYNLGKKFLHGECGVARNLDSVLYYWKKVPESNENYNEVQTMMSTITTYGKKAILYLNPHEKTITANDAEIEMILVDGGTLTIQKGETVYWSSGREYVLSKDGETITVSSFWMSKYEITQGQIYDILGYENYDYDYEFFEDYNTRNYPSTGYGRRSFRFYQYITDELIKALNDLVPEYEFDIPTEKEWEFAARGGIFSEGYKYAGSNMLEEVAWYKSNAQNKIHKVGLKKPNELGFYDMFGNVAEVVKNNKPYSFGERGGSFTTEKEDFFFRYSNCYNAGIRLIMREKVQ
ncbi:MAG: SUMF1/EgtB/PvdO family nonheme iron enzyme [Bacteroidales bacterium]|jgi:formylglycine-generating enzyme required for sulfatase activity|nr:SUMF1/EgtB/PvdO family nonheme iron enzyme [Bacteroidales bacterium]